MDTALQVETQAQRERGLVEADRAQLDHRLGAKGGIVERGVGDLALRGDHGLDSLADATLEVTGLGAVAHVGADAQVVGRGEGDQRADEIESVELGDQLLAQITANLLAGGEGLLETERIAGLLELATAGEAHRLEHEQKG